MSGSARRGRPRGGRHPRPRRHELAGRAGRDRSKHARGAPAERAHPRDLDLARRLRVPELGPHVSVAGPRGPADRSRCRARSARAAWPPSRIGSRHDTAAAERRARAERIAAPACRARRRVAGCGPARALVEAAGARRARRRGLGGHQGRGLDSRQRHRQGLGAAALGLAARAQLRRQRRCRASATAFPPRSGWRSPIAASGKVCVNLQADGDLLYVVSGLYTAAHHRLPLLTVMFNNRTYGNDEAHQEAVAKTRGRPVENKVVGIRIDDPAPDFARIAQGFGVHAEGPIDTRRGRGPGASTRAPRGEGRGPARARRRDHNGDEGGAPMARDGLSDLRRRHAHHRAGRADRGASRRRPTARSWRRSGPLVGRAPAKAGMSRYRIGKRPRPRSPPRLARAGRAADRGDPRRSGRRHAVGRALAGAAVPRAIA